MSWESYPSNADLLENQKKILELLQKIFESDDTTTNLLTKNEATEILGCKERTLRYYLYEDKSLKYLRIGQSIRIKKTEIYKIEGSKGCNKRVKIWSKYRRTRF